MTFTDADKALLHSKGISENKTIGQIETFKAGIPFVTLDKAAVIGDGLLKFSESEEKELIQLFESKRKNAVLLKFVPASGAASRMFKSLFNFIEKFNPEKQTFDAYLKTHDDKQMQIFFEGQEKFPFYDLVQEKIKGKYSNEDQAKYQFVSGILAENSLNFGFYPKGLLPFHKYDTHVATAFEEHLKEAAIYAETDGKAKLHFTISPQHEALFNKEFTIASNRISADTGISFEVDYSFQKLSTDTIAVDLNNEPFRNQDGSILFRPGGHGALIENLNEQDADIIFVKNIDNVVPSAALHDIAASKKILAGLLLKVQEKAFYYAAQLNEGLAETELLKQTKQFLEDEVNIRFSVSYDEFSPEEQQNVLNSKLNRPIRICGMVKNEGEPGGGPFWVQNVHEGVSLQIIESAQINTQNTKQTLILKNATHFNPVDIVCGVKNYKGEKYDLSKFIDPKQGFITEKTKEGRALKAMELPGLWNGAMAYWNTLFVEVPIHTFNPVKTVNDLLRPSHQVD